MLKISQQTTIKLIVAINTLANLHFFYFKALPLPIASPFHTRHIPGELFRGLRNAALWRSLRHCVPLPCSRHPMVHQIEPSLKDCNKKRAAISCNAYFGAPSVGALRIQSCGLNLATSPRETNTSACAKCESVPKGMVQQKSRNIRCSFFWCTIGDSNPGPTD